MADSLDLGTLKIKVKVDGAKQVEQDLKGVADQTQRTDSTANNAQSGIKGLGSAFIDTVKNTKVFGISIGDAVGGMDGATLASGVLGGAMGALVTMGVQVAIQAFTQLIATMKELVVETFNLGVNFQAGMSKVKALSGATAKEFDVLTQGAKKFGTESVYSSTESAQAMTYMAQAGWKTQQIMSGMPGVLNLAAASGEELAQTSDIITTSLNAFGEAASESGRLADVLAVAANETTTDVRGLGEALKYSAPVAGALKMSMEDTAIALGLMANNGIDASMSGTALRSTLTNLAKPTQKMQDVMEEYNISLVDGNGNVKSLGAVMDNLRTSFEGVGDAEKTAAVATIAGKEAMSGMLAIVNTSQQDYNKLTESIYNSSGAAATMASTMTDNIAGLQESISGKFESIKLSVFSIFEPLISGVMKVYDSILNVSEKLWNNIGGIFSKVTAIGTAFVDTFVAVFDTIVDLVYPLVEPLFLLIETMFGQNLKALKTMGNVSIAAIGQIKDALMPFVEFLNNNMMVIIDLLAGNWESAMERMDNTGVLAARGIINAFLLIPNAIIAVINVAIEEINELCNTSIEKIEYITADISGLFGKSKDDLGALAAGTKADFGDVGDSIKDACEEGEEAIESLGKVYEDYLSKNMSEYEKQLREQFNGGTLAEEKKIKRKMELHEQLLKRQLEEDEKYEKRRAELEAKYRKVTVTNGNNTSVRYEERLANGTNNAKGGWTTVGETGRELMYIPSGSKVINNNTTEKILSGRNGNTFTGPINIQASNMNEFLSELKMAIIAGDLS